MTFGAKIPGWLDKIQFITFWVMNPCEVPFIAYIETARPITRDIALVFLTVDFRQFLRAVFRPKWMRSKRHTRRGRRGAKRFGGVPEPADLIADTLDPDHHLRPRRWFLGFRMILEWVDIQDRIFWTIFLVEMLDTLIINTLVGVLEADKSICPNIGRMLRAPEETVVGGAGPILRSVPLSGLEYAVNIESPTLFGATVQEGSFLVVFSGAVRCTYDEGTFQPILFIRDADGEHNNLGEEMTLKDQEFKQFVHSAHIKGPGSVSWRAYAYDGFYYIVAPRAFVIQIGD